MKESAYGGSILCKLQMNKSKCSKIHVGQKCEHCLDCAQGEIMKNHEKQKYLGDIIHSNGKQRATIVERLSWGYGIVANIRALMDNIPLGYRQTQTGIELRQAWLINSIFITVKYFFGQCPKKRRIFFLMASLSQTCSLIGPKKYKLHNLVHALTFWTFFGQQYYILVKSSSQA